MDIVKTLSLPPDNKFWPLKEVLDVMYKDMVLKEHLYSPWLEEDYDELTNHQKKLLDELATLCDENDCAYVRFETKYD